MKKLVKRAHHAKHKLAHKITNEISMLWHAVIGLTLLIMAVQPIMLGINGLKTDVPVAGLKLEGRYISRNNSEASRRAVDTLVASRQDARLALQAGTYKTAITLRQLGVNIDAGRLYDTLVGVGRTGSTTRKLVEQNRALFNAFNFSLNSSQLDVSLTRAYIATLNQKIATAPTNAYFELTPDQQVVVHPDVAGTTIDTDSAISMLINARPELNPTIDLPLQHSPALVSLPALQAVLPEAQNIVRAPLTLTAGPTATVLTQTQLLGMVIPKITPNSQAPQNNTIQVTFDETKLKGTVDTLLKQVERAPEPTIMSGGVVIKHGRSGLKAAGDHALVNVLAALIQRQTGAANPPSVDIPLIQIDPPVIEQAISSGLSPGTHTGTGLVRLTFDDGPGARTEQVLDILARYNVHAAFYVIGRNVPGHASTMQRMLREGHVIGNHSYTHSDLTVMSRAGVEQELSLTQSVIEQACGFRPASFRPPFGAQDQTVRDVAASMGMSVDLWSVDTRDWTQPGSNTIKQRILSADGPGAVVLLHVLYQQTIDALPSIIEGIRAQGYTLE